jgi:aspartyl-tRNA(Asn)/glutamyl-tRNA(Gln) amidotransferase subunit C
MSDSINHEVFNHLVQLAALELDQAEAEYLRLQLNNQLKVINELETIPLDETLPVTTHGMPYSPEITPPIRLDEWIACPNPDEILAQAPQVEERYVIVPEIPHTELD